MTSIFKTPHRKQLITIHTWLHNVKNLYSNISHELGKQAMWFWIEKYAETFHLRVNKKIIPDSIELIPNNYSFQFDNINYIQTLGTAMGTKMVPTYTTLTLAY